MDSSKQIKFNEWKAKAVSLGYTVIRDGINPNMHTAHDSNGNTMGMWYEFQTGNMPFHGWVEQIISHGSRIYDFNP